MRKTVFICIAMVAMLLTLELGAFAKTDDLKGQIAAEGLKEDYIVKPGDTLYGIGRKFGLSYHTIKKVNALASNMILPGMKLQIPQDGASVHVVRTGDTLSGISKQYGTGLTALKRVNELTSEMIRPGMKLYIPLANMSTGRTEEAEPAFNNRTSLAENDIYLLAKLIHAEARGESIEGQIAVGAVILNRLLSGEFPDSIREIIYQSRKGVYQFTPVQDGQINLEPDKEAFAAAQRAIKGEDPTGGALFFYNPEISSDQWIRTLSIKKVIGNHVFAK